MSAEVLSENVAPVEAMDALIARYGLIRVVLALPVALVRRRKVDLPIAPVSDHLARDIGLRPDPMRKMHWDYR